MSGPDDVVYLEWVDSSGQDGWVKKQQALDTSTPSQCRTVGFVLCEDDESVTLMSTVDDSHGNVDNPLTIPKFAVTHRAPMKPMGSPDRFRFRRRRS